MKRLILLLALVPLPLLAAQTGYRVVHPDGTVEYTDEPPAQGGESIRLEEVPTYTPLRQPPASQPAPAHAPEQAPHDYQLEITRPVQNETIWALGSWQVPVQVSVAPPPAPGYSVIILLDGKEAARGAGSHVLQPVYLGTHQISARVVGPGGQTVAESGAHSFYVRRRSILNPRDSESRFPRPPGSFPR